MHNVIHVGGALSSVTAAQISEKLMWRERKKSQFSICFINASITATRSTFLHTFSDKMPRSFLRLNWRYPKITNHMHRHEWVRVTRIQFCSLSLFSSFDLIQKFKNGQGTGTNLIYGYRLIVRWHVSARQQRGRAIVHLLENQQNRFM